MATYTDSWFHSFRDASRTSAQCIVPLLLQLSSPRSVVDFGCGLGVWLSEFQRNGLTDVMGVDGTYVNVDDMLIDSRRFVAQDLTRPVQLNRRFDLCLCLEVAEHLPANAADILVTTLTSASSTILFSAAIPSQGGRNHVNEQWPEYWAGKFAEHGFHPIDAIRRHIWDNDAVDYWYAQNALLFADHDTIERNPKLKEEFLRTTPGQLSLIHPRLYLRTAENLNSTVDFRLRKAMRNLKSLGRQLFMPRAA